MLITKFGRARIYDGYYMITSRKEGNCGKYLHRLVWEDHYQKPIPEGYVIHHINGDKLDNEIQNLDCIKSDKHRSLHMKGKNNPMYGKFHSEETKRKLSEVNKGENNPFYGKHHSKETKRKLSEVQKGEKSQHWKNYARVVKYGFVNGKRNYAIKYEGKRIKCSINKEKLEKICNEINKGVI